MMTGQRELPQGHLSAPLCREQCGFDPAQMSFLTVAWVTRAAFLALALALALLVATAEFVAGNAKGEGFRAGDREKHVHLVRRFVGRSCADNLRVSAQLPYDCSLDKA